MLPRIEKSGKALASYNHQVDLTRKFRYEEPGTSSTVVPSLCRQCSVIQREGTMTSSTPWCSNLSSSGEITTLTRVYSHPFPSRRLSPKTGRSGHSNLSRLLCCRGYPGHELLSMPVNQYMAAVTVLKEGLPPLGKRMTCFT